MWPSLETITGSVLIAIAAATLSPWWWPPLIQKLSHNYTRCVAQTIISWYVFPHRIKRMLGRWRATEQVRNFVGALSFLVLLAGCWIEWSLDQGFQLTPLFVIIAGTTAVIFAYVILETARIIWFVLGGLFASFSDTSEIAVLNPLNRVGVAAPLGEARFATMEEASDALAGNKRHLTPPRFRD